MKTITIGFLGPAIRSCALAVVIGALPGVAFAQSAPAETPASPPPAEARATGLLPEPRIIARSIDFATRTIGDGGTMKNGLYLETSNMPTGAGWISAGPGYRHWYFGDKTFIDASAAISWRAYKMGQARIEFPTLMQSRLTAGAQVRWQDLTQVSYFGEGPASDELNRSEYRLTSTNVVGYATVRPSERLAVTYRAGWLGPVDVGAPTGSFKRGNPSTEEVFAADPVFAREAQPDFIYAEASVAYDSRDNRSHPTGGSLLRAGWTGYSDRAGGAFNFDRSDVEAAQFVPLADGRLVLALHGWLVGSQTQDGKSVPFYLQPSLGGHNSLRAYSDYRFHDHDLLVANLEARVALFTHVDAAVFADAGNVAPKLSELDFSRRAYGFGFRMHSARSTFARVDVAHGDEGWRFMFRMNDPLHLSRLSKRTAPVPFVP